MKVKETNKGGRTLFFGEGKRWWRWVWQKCGCGVPQALGRLHCLCYEWIMNPACSSTRPSPHSSSYCDIEKSVPLHSIFWSVNFPSFYAIYSLTYLLIRIYCPCAKSCSRPSRKKPTSLYRIGRKVYIDTRRIRPSTVPIINAAAHCLFPSLCLFLVVILSSVLR